MLIDITKKREKVPEFIAWCKKLAYKSINNGCSEEKKHELSQQQITLLKSLRDNKLNIIKSYRCAGVSMLMRINTIYNLLYSDSEETYKELYIYQSTGSCQESMRQFMMLLELCEESIYLLEKTQKSLKLRFENKISIIKFVSQGNILNDLSDTYNKIDIDNAAWINNEHVVNDVPEIAKRCNSNVTIASCPDKEGGFFYELWNSTINGCGKFKPISLKWYLDPRFNDNLKGSSGLISYDVDNVGMICEALEHGDMITNDWYEKKKVMMGGSYINEIDGDFADGWIRK